MHADGAAQGIGRPHKLDYHLEPTAEWMAGRGMPTAEA